MKFRHQLLVGASCASLAFIASAPAIAQDEGEQTGLREVIVVSARKRETSLQETPGSVTALQSETLESLGVIDISDIANAIPNVSIGEPRLTNSQIISIRGIAGQDGGVGQDEPVAVYLDGIYLGRPQGHFFSLVDIERVEVLRGPQGTLYGRNSTAGAINIITRRPGGEFGGLVQGTVGNNDFYRVRGAVEGEIGGGLSARGAISYSDFGGDLDNVFTGERVRANQESFGRIALSYERPSGGTVIDLSLDYGRSDADTAIHNMTVNGNVYVDPDRVSLDYPTRSLNRETSGLGLTIEHELTDAITFTSLTGVRGLNFDVTYDADGTDAATFLGAITSGFIPASAAVLRDSASFQHILTEQMSQEFRLAIDTDRMHLLFGAFAYTEDTDYAFDVNLLAQSANIISTDTDTSADATAMAAFMHGAFELSDMFEIEAGLRYSHEDREMRRRTRAAGAYLTEELQADWNDVTGSASVNFRPNDNILTYFTYAQGFKSGGFNALQRGSASFDPETVDSYEIGIKTDFWDDRARFNLSVFHMEYQNLQVRSVLGVGEIQIRNAAEATIEGVELEFQAQFTDDLLFLFNAAHLNAEYDTYLFGAADLSGNRLNQAPEWSFNTALDFRRELAGFGELHAFLSYAYQSEEFYTAENDAINSNPGHESLDARIGWTPSFNSNFTLELWANNLTDDRYVGSVIPLANGIVYDASINRGRTFGADIRAEF